MTSTDHTPSVAPLPPELAALDFDRFDLPDADGLIELAHREVALRTHLARSVRLGAEAEAEYLAAESEGERRAWRERARIADDAAARAAVELHRVLGARADAIRTFGAVHTSRRR
jgi:hypothetical protein